MDHDLKHALIRLPGCRVGAAVVGLERTFEPDMVSAAIKPRAQHRRSAGEPRFDRQLGKILEHATEVFCDKGYEGASMRDLSRATGMSLAGMYHYFGSKERLLYLIQKHTFTTILEKLKTRLDLSNEPEQRIRI